MRCALEGVADPKRNDLAVARPGAEDLVAQQRPLIARASHLPEGRECGEIGIYRSQKTVQ